MTLWVKLCGMRTVEDVAAAAAAGADAVGFVMTPSVRRVGLEDAAVLVDSTPPGITTVGVFYRPDPSWVEHVRDRVGFDLFQAEPENLEGIERIDALPVVHDRPDLEDAVERAFSLASNRVMVEGPGKGGRGRSPDWDRVAGLPRLAEIVIAGGLNGSNVAGAIHRLSPAGVDVSSGVESEPGVKDHRMMSDFVAAARRAAQEPM